MFMVLVFVLGGFLGFLSFGGFAFGGVLICFFISILIFGFVFVFFVLV